ncbi:MAG: hypothetical protein K1X86_10575 [Ignavibacteria bacterium]|nr:hypothetical protein [Ignavibacteria bacterium]
MNNTKLTELLSTFSESELKEFSLFLKSPYFVKGRNLNGYFNFLIKYYPHFNISKNDFIKKYFKGTEYTDEKKNKLIKTYNWELLKFAEEFTAVNSFRKNIYSRNESLLDEFIIRKLGKSAEEVYLFLNEYLKKNRVNNFDYVKKIFTLNSGTIAKRLVSKGNETFEIYKTESENLLNFFLHHAKYLLGSISIQKHQYNPKNPSENISGFLKNIDLEKYIDEYTGEGENFLSQKLAIYNLLILLYPEKFEKYFPVLKEMFEKNISAFGKRDSMNNIALLLNFLSTNYDEKHKRMTFEIINFAIERGIYFEEEAVGLTLFSLSKALTAALNLGETGWAENFVKNNLNRILPEHQFNMRMFAAAHIEHYKGNYELSLKHISDYKMFDEVINYRVRELQIKNFYKLIKNKPEYLETLVSAIDSFRHYLKESKKLTGSHYNTGTNFIEGLNALVNFNYSNSEKKKADAIFKMKNFKPTPKNEWLINEMQNEIRKLKN